MVKQWVKVNNPISINELTSFDVLVIPGTATLHVWNVFLLDLAVLELVLGIEHGHQVAGLIFFGRWKVRAEWTVENRNIQRNSSDCLSLTFPFSKSYLR